MRRAILATLVAACSVLGPRLLTAQALPDEVSSLPWTFDGDVRVAHRVGNTLYVGGFFTTVARPSDVIGPFAVLDAGSARLLSADPTLSSEQVTAAVPDGSGGWFLGGRFVVSGALRTLVHLDAAGRQVPFAPTAEGGFAAGVHALVRQGNVLVVGGAFTHVGGEPRSMLAAIDIPSQSVLPWNPSVTGSHLGAMVVAGTSLFIGGEFTAVGGVPRAHLAKFDLTTGALANWAPAVVGTRVSALGVAGDLLLVGGEFAQVGGQPRANLAAVSVVSGTPTSLAPDPSGAVHALAVAGSTVYLGGAFGVIGGQLRHSAAAVNLTTGAILPWAPLTGGAVVHALAADGTDVFVGGGSWLHTNPGGYAIKVDAVTGVPSASWQPQLGKGVRTIVVNGGQVAVGGSFTTWRARRAVGLVGIDLTTGALVTLPTPDSVSISAMTSSGTTLYVGGYFTSMGSEARTSLAAIDTTTGTVTAFAPVVTTNAVLPVILSLAVSGDDLFVGGQFDAVNSAPRSSLAAIDAVTGATRPFSPPALAAFQSSQAAVTSLAVVNGRVWAGGGFATAGGAPRPGLAVFDATSGALDPLNPLPIGSFVSSLAASGGRVFAAGVFSGVFTGQGFVSRDGLASFDAATGAATSWRPPMRSNGGLAVGGAQVFSSGTVLQLPVPGTIGSDLLLSDSTTGIPVAWDPQARAAVVYLADVGDGVVGSPGRSAAGFPAYYYARRAPGGAPHAVADFGTHAQGTRMTLRWTPALTGALPTSYTILAGSRPGASDVAAVSLPRQAGAGLVAEVPPGAYYLRVVPRANGVDGPASPEVAVGAGVVGCLSPPTAPLLGQRPFVEPPELFWSVAPGDPVAGYELRVGTVPGTHTLARLPLAGPVTRFSAAGAPPGTYYVVVAAAYACGFTAVSNEVMIVVPPVAAPLPPTNLRADVAGSTVSLSWLPVGAASGYRLEAGSAPGLADLVPGLAQTSSQLVVPSVLPGRYYVRVRAVSGALVSPASPEIVVDVP